MKNAMIDIGDKEGILHMTINETSIDVRYAETDQMGVVYHANYLIWFEIGRTKLIEQLGFQYAEMEKDNIISPVIDVKIQYKKPARYGDTVTILTWLEDYNGLRTIYGYKVMNEEDDLLVTGTTEHVITYAHNFRPTRLKKIYPEWHEAYQRELEGNN